MTEPTLIDELRALLLQIETDLINSKRAINELNGDEKAHAAGQFAAHRTDVTRLTAIIARHEK